MSGKPALRPPGGPWAAAVMVWLVALRAPVAEGRDSPGNFVLQFKAFCYFSNGTERVRLVLRHVYNLEDYVRFDSDVGEFRALTPLGRPEAEYWNSQKDLLEEKRAYVDTLCRHNYQIEARTTLQRRGERPARTHSALKSLSAGVGGGAGGGSATTAGLHWGEEGRPRAGPTGDLRELKGDGRGPRTGTWIGPRGTRDWTGAAPAQTPIPPKSPRGRKACSSFHPFCTPSQPPSPHSRS
ncbi:hypothetical protein QTO34_012962, partial [Cnephaeus nilssonii]